MVDSTEGEGCDRGGPGDGQAGSELEKPHQPTVVVGPDEHLIRLGQAAITQWGKAMDAQVEIHKASLEVHQQALSIVRMGVVMAAFLVLVALVLFAGLKLYDKDARDLVELLEKFGVAVISMLAGPQLIRLVAKDKD